MSNLSKTLLTFSKRETLTEADGTSKYGLPEDVVSGKKKKIPEEEEATPITDNPEEETEEFDETESDDGEENATPIEDDPTSPIDETIPGNEPDDAEEDDSDMEEEFEDDEMLEEGEFEEDDIDTNSTDLKILTSLSPKQYAALNVRLYGQFEDLINECKDIVDNTIKNIIVVTKRDVQVKNIVHENLTKMQSDIRNYLMYSFSDVYEENTISYIAYLKRFKIAMKLIELLRKKKNKK